MLGELIYFFKRKIYPGFPIDKDALVVDIGSGDKPFWRGDVFFDKLSLPNNQRFTETGVVDSIGLFIDGDVNKTPFKNKAFDFSFCGHLLEHVKNPELAIKEIVRISKSGYIESPNGLLESILPYQSHIWFIYLDGKKLIFVRKSKKMHDILTKNGPLANKKSWMQLKNPFIRLYWKNNIEYEIIDNLKESEKFYVKHENTKKTTNGGFNIYLLLVKLLRLFFYTKKQNINVLK